MQTIIFTTYTYAELSDSAKAKALELYRASDSDFSMQAECVIEDATSVAALLGIDVDKIYYSGFYSQGDGACFTGSYKYRKGAFDAVVAYAPLDAELSRIAKALQDTQRKNFYKLTANMSHRGRYYHSGCMSVSVEDSDSMYRDIGDSEDDITQALRDFADWIYQQLENQYEFVNSDEYIEDLIINGEYQFTVDGKFYQ